MDAHAFCLEIKRFASADRCDLERIFRETAFVERISIGVAAERGVDVEPVCYWSGPVPLGALWEVHALLGEDTDFAYGSCRHKDVEVAMWPERVDLRVSKDVYQRMGVAGRRLGRDRYEASVGRNEAKIRERICRSSVRNLEIQLAVFCKNAPPGGLKRNVAVSEQHTLTELPFPSLDGPENEEDHVMLLEWIGAVSQNMLPSMDEMCSKGPFISTAQCKPAPCSQTCTLTTTSLRGFFSKRYVIRLLAQFIADNKLGAWFVAAHHGNSGCCLIHSGAENKAVAFVCRD